MHYRYWGAELLSGARQPAACERARGQSGRIRPYRATRRLAGGSKLGPILAALCILAIIGGAGYYVFWIGPKAPVAGFMDASTKIDYAKARQYVTKPSQSKMAAAEEQLKQMDQAIPGLRQQLQQVLQNVKVSIGNTKPGLKEAKVPVTIETTVMGTTQKVDMDVVCVREGLSWKVDPDKTGQGMMGKLMPGFGGGMPRGR